MRCPHRSRACLLLAALSLVSSSYAADWPRFRGPNGTAVSDAKLPKTWSDAENIVWKVDLPGPGSSSPIVTGTRAFVTCYSGYGVERSGSDDQSKLKRHLLCVNLSDGSIAWDKAVAAALPEQQFSGQIRSHGYASHTPTTDGERVYAFFGRTGVVAFDMDGNQLWQAGVGTGSDRMGQGSAPSLTLHQNLLIVNASAESESFIALDKETGKQIWKSESKGYGGSRSTPAYINVGSKTEIAVNMPGETWGLSPKDGGLLWYTSALAKGSNTSLVAKDGVLYGTGGGPGGAEVVAIRAGGRDDVTDSHVLWRKTIGSYVPSPIVVGEHLYWVDDKGIAYCVKAASGEQVYKQRVSGAGAVYASMIAADEKLYVVTRHNGTIVLAAKPDFEQLAHNTIKSDTTDFNASPAVADGRLLLRSNQALYCIGSR